MKSVLISIQPKWCELIASGKKTVEVRKTRPKLETPFKVYIYMTAGNASYPVTKNGASYTCNNNGGKCVIGEFVCDRFIESFLNNNDGWFVELGCLTTEEINEYQGDNPILYGWHISDLVIYDDPRELSEFKKAGFMTEGDWLAYLYPNTHCHYEAWAKKFEIERPPQSWCYVEERSEK